MLQDWDVRVRVLPQGKEILVCSLCLNSLPRHRVRSPDLQSRQCANRVVNSDPGVVEDLLELGGGLDPLVQGKIGLAADVDRIEYPVDRMKTAARHAQLKRSGHLQQFDSLCGVAMIQCKNCTNLRYVD